MSEHWVLDFTRGFYPRQEIIKGHVFLLTLVYHIPFVVINNANYDSGNPPLFANKIFSGMWKDISCVKKEEGINFDYTHIVYIHTDKDGQNYSHNYSLTGFIQ